VIYSKTLNNHLLVVLVVWVGLLMGCDLFLSEDAEPRAAEVDDKVLYVSEVVKMLPIGLSPEDSTTLYQSLVREWVSQNLLLKRAELNLAEDELNVDEKLESYRRSLLIYSYENQYIQQNLDTALTGTEITAYYEAHKENFKLKDNIAQLVFVQLPSNSKEVPRIEKLMRSDKEDDKQEFEDFCIQHAVRYQLNAKRWMVYNDAIAELPISLQTQAQNNFRTGIVTLSDSTGHYMLNIQETRDAKTVAPVEFEAASIRDIILNKRKLDLVKQLEQQIFDEGISKKHAQIN
jgi:hypothetical protein